MKKQLALSGCYISAAIRGVVYALALQLFDVSKEGAVPNLLLIVLLLSGLWELWTAGGGIWYRLTKPEEFKGLSLYFPVAAILVLLVWRVIPSPLRHLSILDILPWFNWSPSPTLALLVALAATWGICYWCDSLADKA